MTDVSAPSKGLFGPITPFLKTAALVVTIVGAVPDRDHRLPRLAIQDPLHPGLPSPCSV